MLDRNLLRRALEKTFRTSTDKYDIAGTKLADAYAKYAADAQSCQGIKPLAADIAARGQILKAVLGAAFATSGFFAPTTIQAIATGISNFWLLPAPIAFVGGVTPGIVTVVLQPTLVVALTRVIIQDGAAAAAGQNISVEIAAQHWAEALHTWTSTIIAAHAPPTPCTGPLT